MWQKFQQQKNEKQKIIKHWQIRHETIQEQTIQPEIEMKLKIIQRQKNKIKSSPIKHNPTTTDNLAPKNATTKKQKQKNKKKKTKQNKKNKQQIQDIKNVYALIFVGACK